MSRIVHHLPSFCNTLYVDFRWTDVVYFPDISRDRPYITRQLIDSKSKIARIFSAHRFPSFGRSTQSYLVNASGSQWYKYKKRVQKGRRHRTEWMDINVFLDGSCVKVSKIGGTAVLCRREKEKWVLRKHLGWKEEHTVYEAELVGMGLAAELVYAERGITTIMAGVDG